MARLVRPRPSGLTTLLRALRTAAEALQTERRLHTRIAERERQAGLLRQHDSPDMADTGTEDLRRLLLRNSEVLAAALAAAQAINENLPTPIDVDAALMAALSERSQIRGR